MDATPSYARVTVFRHLNYRWTLLGLGAGEWLAVLAPGAVYLAMEQLTSAWAGDVPWQAFVLTALVGTAGGLGWARVGTGDTYALQGTLGAAAFVASSWLVLGWLAYAGVGLPVWPACSLVASGAVGAVCAQLRRPPGALGRTLGGLVSPRYLLAVWPRGRARLLHVRAAAALGGRP